MCYQDLHSSSLSNRFISHEQRLRNFRTRMFMESSASESSIPNSVVLVFTLLMHRIGFVGLLGIVRVRMTKENQSAFEMNGVFMIMAIVALFAVEVVCWILFCTNIYSRPSTRDKYYTILKFVCSFSAHLAPFSLIMVLALSPELNWVGYLVVCVMFVITLVCFCFADHQEDKKRPFTPPFNYLGLVLVPLSLVLVLFVPIHLNRIVYTVVYLSLAMENVFTTVNYFKSINKEKTT